jgi:hypothetical protein
LCSTHSISQSTFLQCPPQSTIFAAEAVRTSLQEKNPEGLLKWARKPSVRVAVFDQYLFRIF